MKKYKIFWSKSAVNDLEKIIDFIAKNNKENSLSVLEKIEKRVNKLEEMPQRGSVISELINPLSVNYKQIIEYPWRIIYRIDIDSIYILAVLDGRRSLNDIINLRNK